MPSWTPLTDGVPVLIPDGNNGDVFYYSIPILANRAYDMFMSSPTPTDAALEYAIDIDTGDIVAGSYNGPTFQACSYLSPKAGTLYIVVTPYEDGFTGFHLTVSSYIPQNLVLGYSTPVGSITANTTKFFTIPIQPPGVERGLKLQLSGGSGDGDLVAGYATGLWDAYNQQIVLYAGAGVTNEESMQLYQPNGAPVHVGVVSYDPPSDGASLALKVADVPTGYWTGYLLPTNADDVSWEWGLFVGDDNERFFCFGRGTAHNWIASTLDFATWNISQLPAESTGGRMQWFDAAWSGTELCAVGYSSTVGAVTSYSITTTDAASLSTQALPTISSQSLWESVAWGDGKFVAMSVTKNFATLSGSTWTVNAFPFTSYTASNGQRVVFDGTYFIANSADGTDNRMFRSLNGTSWSTLTPNIITSTGTTAKNGLPSVRYCLVGGDGYAIGVGGPGHYYITYDHGLNWYDFVNKTLGHGFTNTAPSTMAIDGATGVNSFDTGGFAASPAAPIAINYIFATVDEPPSYDYAYYMPRVDVYDFTDRTVTGLAVKSSDVLDYIPAEEGARYAYDPMNSYALSQHTRPFFRGTQPAFVSPRVMYVYETHKPSFWTGFEKSIDQ